MKDGKIQSKFIKSSGVDELIIESTLETDLYVPEGVTEDEFSYYVNENLEGFNGSLVYTLNGEIIAEINIVDGVEIVNEEHTEKNSSKHPCTYEGIQDCTQEAIDNMGTWSKLRCAFTHGICIWDSALDCILANCVPEP